MGRNNFEVNGAEQFFRLSKALKAAGRVELRKELNKELRRAAKPLVGRTRQAALTELPKRGGLAALVAREPQRVQVRTGAATAGVRIVVGKRRGGAQSTNAGVVRHPVFARSDQTRKEWKWVSQKVPGGWFDRTLERDAPVIALPALEAAINRVAQQVVNEARGRG